jgi:hypothetical protein
LPRTNNHRTINTRSAPSRTFRVPRPLVPRLSTATATAQTALASRGLNSRRASADLTSRQQVVWAGVDVVDVGGWRRWRRCDELLSVSRKHGNMGSCLISHVGPRQIERPDHCTSLLEPQTNQPVSSRPYLAMRSGVLGVGATAATVYLRTTSTDFTSGKILFGNLTSSARSWLVQPRPPTVSSCKRTDATALNACHERDGAGQLLGTWTCACAISPLDRQSNTDARCPGSPMIPHPVRPSTGTAL